MSFEEMLFSLLLIFFIIVPVVSMVVVAVIRLVQYVQYRKFLKRYKNVRATTMSDRLVGRGFGFSFRGIRYNFHIQFKEGMKEKNKQ